MFEVGTTGTECFQVTIANDDQLEDSEGFQVSILTSPRDPAVDVPEPVLPITILDDDGMCKDVFSNAHGNVITSFIQVFQCYSQLIPLPLVKRSSH